MQKSVIKKINASQLKVGMYIHDLNSAWMAHPFVMKRFLVSSQTEIDKIHAAGIHFLYIDAAKGLDVKEAPTQEEFRQSIEQEMLEFAAKEPKAPIKTSLREELSQARRVKSQAQRQVAKIMQDARLGKAIKLDDVEHVVHDITASIFRNSSALTSLLRIKNKDNYTFLHSVSVCALLVTFCRSVGMEHDLIHQAGIGGLLHDTGKAMIPDEILNKQGKLTDAEFETIKQHPEIGHDVLKQMEGIGDIPLDIALHHHERMDGNGYPSKHAGNQISQLTQMTAIVDVYDALTSDRCYHKGMPAAEALRRIFEWSKFHFDPSQVHAFIRCVGIYPVGTLVLMESGHLAVVTEPNETDLLAPIVTLFFDTKSSYYVSPRMEDLSKPLGAGGGNRILNHESPDQWQVDPMRVLDLL